RKKFEELTAMNGLVKSVKSKIGISGNRRGRFLHFVSLLLLPVVLMIPVTASAQGEASIGGTVTDATGAIVPQATIRVKNLETGATRTLTTDASGRYEASLLAIGRYEVSAEKTGFKSETKTGVTLVLGQRSTVDVALQVGEVQQSVQVEETA